MAYWLDYSAAKLDGQVIKRAGYAGVIRYLDSPPNLGWKHTTKAEYQSHKAAGLAIRMVMQTTTTASAGGFPTGVAHARRAQAGAQYLGYTGVIYFTNDRTTLPNPAEWQAYLRGAVSVLGQTQVGAYGFANAMDAARNIVDHFWQAGRRSDVRPFVQIWQDNNTQVTVGGITCDRNLILKPLTAPEDDMTPEDRKLLTYVRDIGINNQRRINQANAGIAALTKVMAADKDIDPAALEQMVDAAVAEHTPTAEQNAAALMPLVEDITERVLGADNQDLAAEFIRQLRDALPATEGN